MRDQDYVSAAVRRAQEERTALIAEALTDALVWAWTGIKRAARATASLVQRLRAPRPASPAALAPTKDAFAGNGHA